MQHPDEWPDDSAMYRHHTRPAMEDDDWNVKLNEHEFRAAELSMPRYLAAAAVLIVLAVAGTGFLLGRLI